MGKKDGRGYRGWVEGQLEESGPNAGLDVSVKAGEDRKGSTRGTERRLGPGVGANADALPGALAGNVTMDHKLRRRLAEVLSSAGVDDSRVAIEVLYLLPEEFVRGYTDLFHRALATGEDGRGTGDDRKAELGKARGKAAGKARGGTRGVWQVRNDRALGEKERVDRKLRRMAREMKDSANAGTGKEQVDRCGEELDSGVGCGKWVEKGWKYCPFCGHRRGETLPREG